MQSRYAQIEERLADERYRWLITGVAGFIGSNLLEKLLKLDQRVVGLDNFSTGSRRNITAVQGLVDVDQRNRFTLIDGDIRNLSDCREAVKECDFVLHQAALGSVPRSLEDPLNTNESNIDGFLNIILTARDADVRRFIYAASSSTYGDNGASPKREEVIGSPLSPYAVTKYVNELYADVFHRCYGLDSIGLRYFNVFGQRQDPNGAYAAVIPKWFKAIFSGGQAEIYGDGETARDFCYIDNAVQANIISAFAPDEAANQVYNIAYSQSTSLNVLFELIRDLAATVFPAAAGSEPLYKDFRPGDVRHSLADISRAKSLMGYEPTHSVRDGLKETAAWYYEHLGEATADGT